MDIAYHRYQPTEQDVRDKEITKEEALHEYRKAQARKRAYYQSVQSGGRCMGNAVLPRNFRIG